ncbi:MAG: long-chain fatty acid--CoA ligase [Pelagibacteraceae bacterium]|nr:long-chain fatty acid--CoA ligase [Pelagibacteraceae bacterium]PPR10048.1 MAG: Long-chain-fatty-acid--CoA ligase [Alphaproteobacteria bacterium MarineAlpha11_Bin1]|tara:strand:+ start:2475 stop:4007 length:1533 start_codon:yes stop_codon:yes gene_type:complete
MNPSESGNLGDVFAAYAGSERVAIIDLYDPAVPREYSYQEFSENCDAVANGLLVAGLEPNDRVGILALNRVEFLEVLFGAMRAGCVPVMINVKLPDETVEYIICDAGMQIVFADTEQTARVPENVRTVSFGESKDPFDEFKIRSDEAFPSFFPGHGDIAEQPYTSGSTGRPKGVLLDHIGQVWMTEKIVESRDIREDDCSVISAPLYHKNALLAVKSALSAGGRIVLFSRFDAKEYIRAIERYRLTMLTGVPTMYALILQEEKLLDQTNLSSVRNCSMGSAPASDNLLETLAVRFPDAKLNLNYGITEGGPILFAWTHPDGLPRPPTSVGFPIDGVEIKLVGGPDEDQGVLHVKSPGVMKGYHNLPDATKNVLSAEGWMDTGDILRRDDIGWYYFVDRADDMFVCAGENIYPSDVETMLERHQDVMQAAVVPAPHPLKSHVPFAWVVKRDGSILDEEAVKEHSLKNGPVYAYPRRVFFVDALPLSGTNKIDRRALEARAVEKVREDDDAT